MQKMDRKRRNNTVYLLTTISLMIAIQLIFGFTPLGTIQTPIFTITLMGIPLAIFAAMYGPIMGAIGGIIWGLISIAQAFMGMDATGTLILNQVNDVSWGMKIGGMICMCIIARMLAGLLAGIIFDLIHLADKHGIIASAVSSAAVSIFNTVLFMSFFCLFFYNSELIQETLVQPSGATNPFYFVVAIVGTNFFIEVTINMIVGTAVSYLLFRIASKIGFENPFPRIEHRKERISDINEITDIDNKDN